MEKYERDMISGPIWSYETKYEKKEKIMFSSSDN